MYMYVYMYVYIYIYMYMCTYVYMYVLLACVLMCISYVTVHDGREVRDVAEPRARMPLVYNNNIYFLTTSNNYGLNLCITNFGCLECNSILTYNVESNNTSTYTSILSYHSTHLYHSMFYYSIYVSHCDVYRAMRTAE